MKAFSNDRGAVAVESALIVALLLVPLLIGIIDVARLIHTNIIVTEAAQEALTYLAYDDTLVDPDAHTRASVDPYTWNNFDLLDTCEPDDHRPHNGGVAGGVVTATVSEDVELFFPFLGDDVTLTKTASGYRFSACPP